MDAYFFSSAISDVVFNRMKGKSFKEDCTVPREDLRYLKVLYCGGDGKSYVGDSGSLSRHVFGKAIDINPLYNPYIWTDQEGNLRCDPEEGEDYLNREKEFSYKMQEDDLCCQLI